MGDRTNHRTCSCMSVCCWAEAGARARRHVVDRAREYYITPYAISGICDVKNLGVCVCAQFRSWSGHEWSILILEASYKTSANLNMRQVNEPDVHISAANCVTKFRNAFKMHMSHNYRQEECVPLHRLLRWLSPIWWILHSFSTSLVKDRNNGKPTDTGQGQRRSTLIPSQG